MKTLLLFTVVFCFSNFLHADHHQGSKAYGGTPTKGLVILKSSNDVKATADKLEGLLQSEGMTVFNRIDHSTGAKKVGSELRPTELVIFGNPKVGTPLMQCAQSVAIDLPQKMLIWEDETGVVWLGYNDPKHLQKRHKISGCDEVLKKVAGALKNFAAAATSP